MSSSEVPFNKESHKQLNGCLAQLSDIGPTPAAQSILTHSIQGIEQRISWGEAPLITQIKNRFHWCCYN